MKKIIALVAMAAIVVAFSISTVGKKLPSVGYVLVGPKKRWGLVNETLARIPILNKTWI